MNGLMVLSPMVQWFHECRSWGSTRMSHAVQPFASINTRPSLAVQDLREKYAPQPSSPTFSQELRTQATQSSLFLEKCASRAMQSSFFSQEIRAHSHPVQLLSRRIRNPRRFLPRVLIFCWPSKPENNSFFEKLSRPRRVAPGVGLGPRGRQLKENPGPSPFQEKTHALVL